MQPHRRPRPAPSCDRGPDGRAAQGRRPALRGRGGEPRRAAARDPLPGRRIRLGQVGHRASVMGLLPKGQLDPGRRPRAARGRGPAAGERAAPARAALHPHVDDLPGADDRAQPGDELRRADRRGAAHPHPPRRRRRARERILAIMREVRLPEPELLLPRLPASALGRPAPADHDRDGAGAGAGAADRRRADHRARRHHPGADPAADQGPAAPARRPACCSSPTTSAWSPRSPIGSR